MDLGIPLSILPPNPVGQRLWQSRCGTVCAHRSAKANAAPDVGAARMITRRLGFWLDVSVGAGLVFLLF